MKSLKNYISQNGFNKLAAEYENLAKVERPKTCEIITWAAGNGDRSENSDYIYGKKRLREIDRRMRFLSKRLEASEIVDYLKSNPNRVLFGATVTIDNGESEKTYTIVGVDEIETKENKISYLSPIGKALMGREVGDEVVIKTPSGTQHWEITQLQYLQWD